MGQGSQEAAPGQPRQQRQERIEAAPDTAFWLDQKGDVGASGLVHLAQAADGLFALVGHESQGQPMPAGLQALLGRDTEAALGVIDKYLFV